ncbi:MAG: ABC transporter ATP-binding protein/permease [Rhodocyclaceae bacterium]
MRWTVWGRQFRLITGAYFSPKRSWRPLAGLAIMLFVSLLAVRMNLLFSFWSNGMFTSLQTLDSKLFWFSAQLFAILATVHVVQQLFNAYLRTAFGIHWRAWLNEQLVQRWLDSRAYYLARFADSSVDNPEQRIQQDLQSLADTSVSLSLGLVAALVSIVSFTALLWSLAGPMNVLGHEIPRGMVFLVYIYVLTASFFAFWIGRPLIRLNFLAEQFSATYRYLLIRVRENAESIALYRGESVESERLHKSFASVIANAWATLWRELKFTGYNFSIGQAGVIFPLLIQGPRVLTGSIKLGDLTQTLEAFNQVQDSLSFFRESYDKFAAYRAVLERLNGFVGSMDEVETLDIPARGQSDDSLRLEGFSVMRPDGGVLIEQLSLFLVRGQRLLVRGASGSGKTTLLRAIAGLWPYTTGRMDRPADTQVLFLSQKPYLPIGSLRAALAYPALELPKEKAVEILSRVQLGHLSGVLDTEHDWSQILSPGEQQRLAFGRVLVNRPSLLVMDEASSALDEGLEHALYSLMMQELPDSIVLSVGHHASLAQFHQQALELRPQGAWQIVPGHLATGLA